MENNTINEATTQQPIVDEDLAFDASTLIKKKKKKTAASFSTSASAIPSSKDTAPGENETDKEAPFYSYDYLVERFYSVLRANNPELAGEKRKFTLIPPDVVRESSKKTAFCNIAEISKRIKRPQDHLTQFILAELGTTGNNDAQMRLIIRGRFQQPQIEAILKKYILEYVTCKTCRSGDTQLTKDNRLYFVQCDSCGSSRSVATIKSGFQAQTARRAAVRAAQT